MTNKKEKICIVPKCKKEVHESKALFCGEHERDYKDKRKKFGQGALGIGAIAIGLFSQWTEQ